MGVEQSRRDDLESVGFVLVYFLKGKLPWQGLPAKSKNAKYDKIKEKKVATKIEELAKGIPKEVGSYLEYCRNLKFEDKPDYKLLRNYLADAFERLGYEHDYYYDWIVKKHNISSGNLLNGTMHTLPSTNIRGPLNRPKEE